MNGVVSSHRIGPSLYTSSHMRSEEAIFEYFFFLLFLLSSQVLPAFCAIILLHHTILRPNLLGRVCDERLPGLRSPPLLPQSERHVVGQQRRPHVGPTPIRLHHPTGREPVRHHLSPGRGLAQLPPRVPQRLPDRRVRLAYQPDIDIH